MEKEKPVELTEKEYDKLLTDLEKFEESFYEILAGSNNYDIIATTDAKGNNYTKEQLDLIKRECSRYGIKTLYKIDINSSVYILVNPENLKIGYISEEMH